MITIIYNTISYRPFNEDDDKMSLDRKIFHRLVDPDSAILLVLEKAIVKPLGVERVKIDEALYRVTAEDIYAPIDHPPFDRSEVDGYAVRSIDIAWADELSPVKLRVKGSINVGEHPQIEVGVEEAVELSTGAMIPRGADAVVMEEHCERDGEFVKVYRSVSPGENISTGGSDISGGDLVIPEGTLLKHQHIGLLSGLGVTEVAVYTRPRAAVISTGVEIVPPGNPLPDGKIYDTNGRLITAFLREMGIDASFRGVIGDSYEEVKDTVTRLLETHDVVVTSGGTSAGVHDVVYRVFEDIGEIIMHGLRTKPGKPTVIAHSKGKLLIGLPGFPLSAYMVLIRVIRPILATLTGLKEHGTNYIYARIPFQLKKQAGVTWLVPVSLIYKKNGYVAYPLGAFSGSISPLLFSDGFAEIPLEKDFVREGEEVRVYLFREMPPPDRLTIIGSNDPLLLEILRREGLLHNSRVINAGSLAGWKAISSGEADIAPTHLLDEETLSYNTPFMERFGLKGKAILYHGYLREIGIIVPRGNPKNITGIEDFLRSDVRIVNRVKGSGIRTYLDYVLKKIFESRGLDWKQVHKLVNGYTYEVKTHTAVGLAVKQGRADAGIGATYVAEIFDLDYIPLGWEEYDFLVSIDSAEKKEVKRFLEALRRRDFFNELGEIYSKHYKITEYSGTVKAG